MEYGKSNKRCSGADHIKSFVCLIKHFDYGFHVYVRTWNFPYGHQLLMFVPFWKLDLTLILMSPLGSPFGLVDRHN